MKRVLKNWLFAIACGAALPSFAAQKTIAVTFEITKGHEYDTYTKAQKNELVTMVVQQVSQLLQTAFPIFEFNATGANTLAILLRDEPSAAGVVPAVELAIQMDPTAMPDDPAFIVELRKDAVRSEPFAEGHKGLANEIVQHILKAVEKQRDLFVTTLFHSIDITDDVFPLEGAFGLPFKATDYSIHTDSRFALALLDAKSITCQLITKPDGEMKGTNPPIPARFLDGLRTTVDDQLTNATLVSRLSNEVFTPKAVVLNKYRRTGERAGNGQVAPTAAQIGPHK
jgi:hypothetical protein